MSDPLKSFIDGSSSEGVTAAVYVHETGDNVRFYMDTDSNAAAIELLRMVIRTIEQMESGGANAS